MRLNIIYQLGVYELQLDNISVLIGFINNLVLRERCFMNSLAYTTVETVDDEGTSWFEAPNQTGTPERRLILAVVERAVLDFVGNDAREAEAAEAWLFDDDDDDGENSASPFSMTWACQQLDLDITNIREQIKAMPKRGKNRVAPWYFSRATQLAPVALAAGS